MVSVTFHVIGIFVYWITISYAVVIAATAFAESTNVS